MTVTNIPFYGTQAVAARAFGMEVMVYGLPPLLAHPGEEADLICQNSLEQDEARSAATQHRRGSLIVKEDLRAAPESGRGRTRTGGGISRLGNGFSRLSSWSVPSTSELYYQMIDQVLGHLEGGIRQNYLAFHLSFPW